MSVLTKYYDKEAASLASPIPVDYDRVVSFDSDGNEIISFVKTDYPSIVRSHGTVEDWSLDNLLKAGVSPDFNIHTGFNTRLDGLDSLAVVTDHMNSVIDSSFVSETPKSDE